MAWKPNFTSPTPFSGMPSTYGGITSFKPTAANPLPPWSSIGGAASSASFGNTAVDIAKLLTIPEFNIGKALETGIGWIDDILGGVTDLIDGAWANFSEWGASILSNVGETVNNIYETVSVWVGGIYSSMRDLMVSALASMSDFFADALQDIRLVYANTLNTVKDRIAELRLEVFELLGKVRQDALSWVADELASIADSLSLGFAHLASRFEDLMRIPADAFFTLVRDFFFEEAT